MVEDDAPEDSADYFGWIIESQVDSAPGKIDFALQADPLQPEVVQEFNELIGGLVAIRPTLIDFLVVRENYLNLIRLPDELADHWNTGRLAILDAGLRNIETHVAVERSLGAFLASASAFKDRLEVRLADKSVDPSELKVFLGRLYDSNFAYRLCYNLRNFGQHRANPVHVIPVTASRDQSGTFTYTLRFELDANRLIGSGSKFQPKVKAELSRMKEGIPLLPNCALYYKCMFELFLWYLSRSGSDIADVLGYEAAIRRAHPTMPIEATPFIFHGKPKNVDGEFKCRTTSFSFDELAILKMLMSEAGLVAGTEQVPK